MKYLAAGFVVVGSQLLTSALLLRNAIPVIVDAFVPVAKMMSSSCFHFARHAQVGTAICRTTFAVAAMKNDHTQNAAVADDRHDADASEDDFFNSLDLEADADADATATSSRHEDGEIADTGTSLQQQQQEDLPAPRKKSSSSQWESLHPKVKLRIIREGQRKAIENKKKREPASAKKRRMMMYYKEAQVKRRKDSRIRRPVPASDRVPLTSLVPGANMNGTIISLTNFGAYVDVGTEVDGLLHVSQMSGTDFVEHPREVCRPGDRIEVTVSRVSPELKKFQLTMLPGSLSLSSPPDDGIGGDGADDDRIKLEEIEVDDELWGEINRVTRYGAYVELGAVVDGFLHFMDHPEFGVSPTPRPPSSYMSVGQRVRVWASEVDADRGRIKLTAIRPATLPRIRRERGAQ